MTVQSEQSRLFTIGHSNHEAAEFVSLLKLHGVTAVADVRSEPFSRFNPQFNREHIQSTLREHGIAYVFLGRELGARRSERECYVNGVARYDLIAKTPAFTEGLARIRKGMQSHRVAMMCAEKDPLICHRMILVARCLRSGGIAIDHIHEDGTIESTAVAENRLVELFVSGGRDLFRTRDELVEEAYDLQGSRIAFTEDATEEPKG